MQWSFSLGSDRRYSLYARSTHEAPAAEEDASTTRRPAVTEWGLRGVPNYLPQHRLMVHTPDCDPVMPHLAKCLDEVRAAEFLAPMWESATAEPEADGESPGVHCRRIGCKPGRRAAVCYERKSREGTGQRMLGKTYHKRQAEQLARLHYQLNDAFGKCADGAVRVSNPVVYVPEVQMALFRWAPGEAANEQSCGLAAQLALRRTSHVDRRKAGRSIHTRNRLPWCKKASARCHAPSGGVTFGLRSVATMPPMVRALGQADASLILLGP